MKLSPNRFRPDATNFNTFPTVPTYPFTLWSDAVGIFVSMIDHPTQDELKYNFIYDPETGIFTRKNYTRECDRIAGSKNDQGYVCIKINKKSHKAHRLAWIYFYGENPACEIDHIDHDTSNNSISNLRLVNGNQNAWNRPIYKNNKSGYKGVIYHKASGKWVTQVRMFGKTYSAGYFNDPHKAAAAIISLREKLHGEFTCHG